MEAIETIYIDEDNRLAVYYDDFTDSPLDWGWSLNFHKIEYRYGNWEIRDTNGDPLARLFNELEPRLGEPEKMKRALHIYQVYTGDSRAFKIVDIRVYRDRYTYLVVGEDEGQIDSMIDIYSRYLNGEVYTVAHERRERYVSVSSPENYMDSWDEVDAIGGCYLDNEYTAEVVAREHFDI